MIFVAYATYLVRTIDQPQQQLKHGNIVTEQDHLVGWTNDGDEVLFQDGIFADGRAWK